VETDNPQPRSDDLSAGRQCMEARRRAPRTWIYDQDGTVIFFDIVLIDELIPLKKCWSLKEYWSRKHSIWRTRTV